MFPENLLTTSGLLILLHGIISLSDGTSCDNDYFFLTFQSKLANMSNDFKQVLEVRTEVSNNFLLLCNGKCSKILNKNVGY